MLPGIIVKARNGSTLGYVKAIHRSDGSKAGSSSIVEVIIRSKEIGTMWNLMALKAKVAEHLGLNPESTAEQLTCSAQAKLVETGGNVTGDDILPSYLYHFGLRLEYVSPVWKILYGLSSFKPSPGNVLLFTLDQDITPPISQEATLRLSAYHELEGEWFAGRVEGIVAHRSIPGRPYLSERTGLVIASSVEPRSQETRFGLVNGDLKIMAYFPDYVTLRSGEVVALRGDFDPVNDSISVTSVLNVGSLEMWSTPD